MEGAKAASRYFASVLLPASFAQDKREEIQELLRLLDKPRGHGRRLLNAALRDVAEHYRAPRRVGQEELERWIAFLHHEAREDRLIFGHNDRRAKEWRDLLAWKQDRLHQVGNRETLAGLSQARGPAPFLIELDRVARRAAEPVGAK